MSATIIYSALKKFGALSFLSDDEKEKLAKEFTLVRAGTTSKYNNMVVEYKGIKFHSLSEAYYYYLLLNSEVNKKIVDIKLQVKYPLHDIEGTNRLRYVADFVVTTQSGKEYVIDVKGRMTPENRIKLSYFNYVYKKPVHAVWTAGLAKFDTSFIH